MTTTPTLKSDEYTAFQAAFCDPETSTILIRKKVPAFHKKAFQVYEACQKRFPERFCLPWLIGMFNAFAQACPAADIKDLKRPRNVIVEYDTKQYYTDVYTQDWQIGRKLYDSTHIKLSNDGYFYSEDKTYAHIGKHVKHHEGRDFLQLDLQDSTLVEVFEPILSYAASFLGVPMTKMQFKALHCFDDERMDFEFREPATLKMLHVTFEPGSCEEAFFTDTWQTLT